MKVKLSYFRNSGKKFGESEYNTEETKMASIVNEVRGLKINNTLPGIKELDVIVLVEAEVENELKSHLVM
ncbi:hypothetical protein [Clostridium sp.]|uniref:hypothetical protein n=1 Tax=Clostridium sp. TaxID=1506 RepID=UPI003996B86D